MDENMKLIMAEFAKLNNRLTGIEDQITNLGERMTSLEERTTSLEERMTNLEERTPSVSLQPTLPFIIFASSSAILSPNPKFDLSVLDLSAQ